MGNVYPEENYVELPLRGFSPGQHLYGSLLHNGKRIHVLLSFMSTTTLKVTAQILAVLPPHADLMNDKKFKKEIKINIQACYVYGKLPGSPFPRACYFKHVDENPA